MDELSCTLSPLVFAELYRLLAADLTRQEVLEDRLAEIGYDHAWLGTAADAYDAYWEAQLKWTDATGVGDLVVPSAEHARLATWILAGLRITGDDRELGSALATNVLQRALTEVPGLKTPLPPSLSPVIVGWTLGQIIGVPPYEWPVAPAELPDDVNLRSAFLGLVHHVLVLEGMAQPWPEMMQTSMYWRGYGIAEALKPDAHEGSPAILRLLQESRPLLSQHLSTQLNRHFSGFGQRRNALSHVTDDARRERFVDVVASTRGWEDLRMTVLGMTQFVCQEISRSLYDAEEPPPALRNDPWTYLKREISTEWLA
ncbi:hypothetical protein [Streptomyces muensis]|uniref:Uncharacterized protein n=1 Tax=Streptomyces muensis TaxID=1077944 RepID=A0A9X1TKN3_STRM4|nr:hypothetical protein [Streptomyces muensis]MCF1594567.1 hypothetical protein [Streptomyces muensis]